jgi:hypothetical protein
MVDIRNKLPNMVGNIIQATDKNTAPLPKLAIIPVQLQGGADQRLADTLTQILSIHIIRSGKYTVYPRTKSLEQVIEEHKIQLSGITADSNVVGIGYGENPNLVLSVVARRLEDANMFNAAVINLFSGTQVVGRSVDYRDINDGIRAMERLSVDLTSTAAEISQRQQAEDKSQKEDEQRRLRNQQAAQKKAKKDAFWDEKSSYAKRNSFEYLSGYFEWGDDFIGGGGSILSTVHWSPISFLNIGFETRFGTSNEFSFYFSLSPMLGLTIPINENVIIFSDGILGLGYFGGIKGMIFDWMTPAFDIGILFWWGSSGDIFPGIDIKYRGTWYDGFYTNSIGFSIIFLRWN